MKRELISKKTRIEFREHFVEWTLREIETEFDSADVPFADDYTPTVSGQRRSLVEQYYHAVDWTNWEHVRRVITVYEHVLVQLTHQAELGHAHDGQSARIHLLSLQKWLERDGFEFTDGKLHRKQPTATLADINRAISAIDATELHRQIERMRQAVDQDPTLAIGTAKELVESTCKTILRDREEPYDEGADLVTLLKTTRNVLSLLPQDVDQTAKGAQSIRKLLSNLGTVGQCLAELRNLYGTGHGRGGGVKGLTPRHARLAVGASATLSTFLFDTHQERQSTRDP